MHLSYPSTFETLLSTDLTLRSGVDSLTVVFDSWLRTSRVPFFPDYTDHGIEHLNQVLTTTDQLITPASRSVFTAADAAILTVSVLFHDAALHLSEAGFHDVIHGSAADHAITGFNDQPWPVLWEQFLFSAKRWDERRLREVFGESPDGAICSQVRDPFDDYNNLTSTDRKLIGEFIRRHHPRLAHEFAVFGVPGKTTISFTHVLQEDLRDIAGLVARSHGLSVRDSLPYLQNKYHKREYNGIHAVYLMTLLRLADYFQIQSSRAPSIVFQYRHIPSKFSELEWKAHNAIRNITRAHDDPESIEIQALPTDVHTYLRLKEWLSGIQGELDASWAVLGETYGSQAFLNQLGLLIRRVRSNLDSSDSFGSTVSYVPDRVELAVARPDLLNLLVGPLYDNIPSIGVRELLQNAIDAVRERELLQSNHPELQHAELISQQHDIEIRIGPEDRAGVSWLSITDRGVGMTVDTVRDYFLTAGASFRKSDAWKRDFESSELGKSHVLRSGRFGVGVLAGFLLGNRMEVSTRHIRSAAGVRFTTTLDLSPIELRHDGQLKVGTQIRIPISRVVRQQLLEQPARVNVPGRFDWYIYSTPTVGRTVEELEAVSEDASRVRRRHLRQKRSVSRPSQETVSTFRQLRGQRPYLVYWSHEALPHLSVNGIFVTESETRSQFASNPQFELSSTKDEIPFYIEHPRVCIDDPDGQFPLNVRRSDITEFRYPFEDQLFTDVVDDYVSYMIVNAHEAMRGKWPRGESAHPGVYQDVVLQAGPFVGTMAPAVFRPDGVAPLLPTLTGTSEAEVIYVALPVSQSFIDPYYYRIKRSVDVSFLNLLPANGLAIAVASFRSQQLPEGFQFNELASLVAAFVAAGGVYDKDGTTWQTSGSLAAIVGARSIRGARIICPKGSESYFGNHDDLIAKVAAERDRKHEKRSNPQKDDKKLLNSIRDTLSRLTIARTVGNHIEVETAGCPKTRLNTKELEGSNVTSVCIVELHLVGENRIIRNQSEGFVTTRWRDTVGQAFVPLDMGEREEKCKKAYDALGGFIMTHKMMSDARVCW